jgi:hypothetical protein
MVNTMLNPSRAHGLNDQEMIEMTSFEEFGFLGREFGHADDYP